MVSEARHLFNSERKQPIRAIIIMLNRDTCKEDPCDLILRVLIQCLCLKSRDAQRIVLTVIKTFISRVRKTNVRNLCKFVLSAL
jgi:hypothetical protein